MGIPVQNKQNGGKKQGTQQLTGEAPVKEQRGLKSKNAKETKEQKEKMEADFK